MKIFRDIYNWLKGKKPFTPIRKTTVVHVHEAPTRKNIPVNRISKSGKRYRLIKHASNKKAHSPAYTQRIDF